MKISIIMPTYNRAFIIKRAVDSVISQTYSDWELIIIDDGSSDNTQEVIKPYTDSRITYIGHNQNKGVNFARNFGLSKCTGEVITFLDSDDEFLPYTLAHIHEYIKKYSSYKIFAFPTKTENNIVSCKLRKEICTPDYTDILAGKYSGEFLMVIKKEILPFAIFPEYVSGFEGITWMKLIKQFSIIYINDILRIYWQDTQSILRYDKLSDEKIKNNLLGYKVYLELFDDKDIRGLAVRSMKAYCLAKFGYYDILLKNYREGLKSSLKAFITNPFELRIYQNILVFIRNVKKGEV